jgi:hypothetical protein
VIPRKLRQRNFALGRELERAVNRYLLGYGEGRPKMMTLVLIWLTLSVVIGACVCRLLTLAGPGNPEKVIYTGYLESFFEDR